jgi:hypothetical protein
MIHLHGRRALRKFGSRIQATKQRLISPRRPVGP